MVKFLSLSSGSNGNCYYVGNERCAFLIDAGIGPRTIKKRLAAHDLSLSSVKFGAELMKLSVSTRLRFFITET